MKCSDNQGKPMIEHSMKSEEIVIFSFLCDYPFSFTKKKKDQHFNRKKTRENHLSEGK